MNRSSSLRLLLVEDNPGDSLLAQEALDSVPGSHFDVTEATRLDQALRLLGESQFAVVVLDLNLPDSFGLETLRALRDHRPDTPVVVLSGTSAEEFYWEAFQAGAQDCIPKGDLTIRLLGRSVLYALERHRAQAIQHQSEKLVQFNPDAIVVADAEGMVRFVNDAAVKFFGKTRPEFVGSPFGYPMSEDVVTEITFESSTGLRVGAIRATTIRWYDEPASVAVIRDVTENKRLETQLRQAMKLQALGTVAGGIAHDFNNILPAIIINAQLALDDVAEDNPSHQSLLEILKAGERARDLVSRILTYCRQEEPPRETIDLRAAINESFSLIRSGLPPNVELVIQLSDQLPNVLANRGAVNRILLNLGANAGQAMPAQGGRVEISATEVQVDKESGEQLSIPIGLYVRLGVRDNGHGMDAGTVERIFDPFFTTRGRRQGTGLGLSVVHGIVESHRGAITVESAPGRGTLFEVFLPASGEITAVPELTKVDLASGAGLSILYVDDDEAMVFLASRTLKRLGYKVEATTDVQGALTSVLEAPGAYDLVVSDLAMPAMSGFELLSRVRAANIEIPFLLISGYVDAETAESAREAGATSLILKPATVEELAEAVHRIAQAAGE